MGYIDISQLQETKRKLIELNDLLHDAANLLRRIIDSLSSDDAFADRAAEFRDNLRDVEDLVRHNDELLSTIDVTIEAATTTACEADDAFPLSDEDSCSSAESSKHVLLFDMGDLNEVKVILDAFSSTSRSDDTLVPDSDAQSDPTKKESDAPGTSAASGGYMYCTRCGTRIPREYSFCTCCGAPLRKSPDSESRHGSDMPPAPMVSSSAFKDFFTAGTSADSTKNGDMQPQDSQDCVVDKPQGSPESAAADEPQGALDHVASETHEAAELAISKVHFSAIAPKTFTKGECTIVNLVMYENAFRDVVDELIASADLPVGESRSGTMNVKDGARVQIALTSPDVEIEDGVETQTWCGEYLNFYFAVALPADFRKAQILFTATVYIDDIIATRLKFVAKCKSLRQQKIAVYQDDVLSAFVSYASEDRHKVATIIQGMEKARPDMDIFFDVESLRSGDTWEQVLADEIDRRDTLFLCWSRNAMESRWVDAEWRYALTHKGMDAIEPVPLEPPSVCPPPQELRSKHFNDRLLYVINDGSGK